MTDLNLSDSMPDTRRAVCKAHARFPVDEPPYCDCLGAACKREIVGQSENLSILPGGFFHDLLSDDPDIPPQRGVEYQPEDFA